MQLVLTLGIDLASEDRRTGCCSVRWSDGAATVEALEIRLSNADLRHRLHRAEIAALDAPFGWPDRFRTAVACWSESDSWPLPWPDAQHLRELRLRATDRWIADNVKQPLSVSSAGIAVTAWRAAALLTEFYAEHELPLDRVYGRVREAYPGAALVAWDLAGHRTAESYKSSRAAREALLERLAPAAGWLQLSDPQRELLAISDHCTDALICSLVARAAAVGLTYLPPDDLDVVSVAREGWIAHPLEHSLDRLPRP